jgi:hypothetical protein
LKWSKYLRNNGAGAQSATNSGNGQTIAGIMVAVMHNLLPTLKRQNIQANNGKEIRLLKNNGIDQKTDKKNDVTNQAVANNQNASSRQGINNHPNSRASVTKAVNRRSNHCRNRESIKRNLRENSFKSRNQRDRYAIHENVVVLSTIYLFLRSRLTLTPTASAL